ncbi:MAG: PSP1 domain-containing protein [Christensenellaceae bacterium]|jgi:cell fate regulator YaaT (PSP1 superfamily)
MKTIIGVRFSETGKMYYFDPGELALSVGDQVLVETTHGVELGEVVMAQKELADKSFSAPIKKVIKKADEKDFKKLEKMKQKEQEAEKICLEKIAKHNLDMKLIDVEYTFDGNKIIFYFTADGRVDFRELVKDLASVFKTRIELRQIGVRDEAKKIGGLGPCGRPCCCNAFLDDFQPVSIKMAKEQSLSLSPTKISGLCGRLMCCLNYEQQHYHETRKKLPKTGSTIKGPDGEAEVISSNALTEQVKCKIELPDGSFDIRVYPLSEIKMKRKKNARVEKDIDETIDEEIKSLLDE